MLKNFLLIDFGASRIKAAIFESGNVSEIKDYPAITPCPAETLKQAFINIVTEYSDKHKLSGILTCSEMHGFMLVDEKNTPLSDYISWKDQRCLNKIDDISSYEVLNNKLEGYFFPKTGMNPRPCYPVFNVFHLIRENKVKSAKVISLPEWLR